MPKGDINSKRIRERNQTQQGRLHGLDKLACRANGLRKKCHENIRQTSE